MNGAEAFIFDGTNLTQASFHRTPLAGIHLGSCDIAGIIASPAELKGAMINMLQAAELVRLMGVIVE